MKKELHLRSEGTEGTQRQRRRQDGPDSPDRASRMGRVRAGLIGLLALCALSQSSCGNDGTVINVTVAGNKGDIVSLQPVISLDGKSSKQIASVTTRLDALSLKLPEGTRGHVRIELEATGTSTCIIAQGIAEFDAAGEVQIDMPITLVYLPSQICPLTIELGGQGKGKVTSDPVGIDCGDTCRAKFSIGYRVHLVATPDENSYVASWEGTDCVGSTCDLTLKTPLRIIAQFSPKTAFQVSKSGDGTGTVTSDPAGLSCGEQCTYNASAGSRATLRAVPAKDSYFAGWTGGCTGTGACSIQVGSTPSVVASFIKKTCTPDGLCWENPLPFGSYMRHVFGLSDDDVWGVGEYGMVVRNQGGKYTILPRPGDSNSGVYAIWGTSATNMWVGGNDGQMYQWDGTQWKGYAKPAGSNSIYDMWGIDANNIWAVGYDNAIRWNGTAWVRESLPASPRGYYELRSVHGSAANNVWIVGYPSTILRYDGTSWKQMATPFPDTTNYYAFSVWTFGANSTWIGTPSYSNNYTLYYWDGVSWKGYSTGTNNQPNDIFANGPNEIYAVMYNNVSIWDGKSWRDDPQSSELDLQGIWSGSANTYWIAGNNTLPQRNDRIVQKPYAPNSTLYRAYGASENDIWVVGDTNLARWNGSVWTVTRGPQNGNGRSIWGASAKDIWIGGYQNMFHYDGTDWTGFPASAQGLYATWGADSQTVYSAGDNGVIVKWDGTKWKSNAKVGNQTFFGMWGADAVNIWAVGCGGTVAYYDGVLWTPVTAISSMDNSCFFDVHGTSKNDVWAVSQSYVWHWNGTAWTRYTEASGNAVYARSANEVWIGQYGRVFKWDGTMFQSYEANIGFGIYGVWGNANTGPYFFGDSNMILRWSK